MMVRVGYHKVFTKHIYVCVLSLSQVAQGSHEKSIEIPSMQEPYRGEAGRPYTSSAG